MKYFLIFMWLDTSLAAHSQELVRSSWLEMFSTPEACDRAQAEEEGKHKNDVVLVSACAQTSDKSGTILFKMNVK